MRDWTAEKRRVPLELTEDEVKDLDALVETRKTRTRSRLIRRALRFYKVLSDLKEQGYLIQGIKPGSLLQFPDLDVPYPQDVPIKRR